MLSLNTAFCDLRSILTELCRVASEDASVCSASHAAYHSTTLMSTDTGARLGVSLVSNERATRSRMKDNENKSIAYFIVIELHVFETEVVSLYIIIIISEQLRIRVTLSVCVFDRLFGPQNEK